jgi:putative flippase GtrA
MRRAGDQVETSRAATSRAPRSGCYAPAGVVAEAMPAKPTFPAMAAIVLGLAINKSFGRYVVVGLASNASGYCAYLLITWIGGGPKASMTFLYAVGTLLGFLGNGKWTFAHRGRAWPSLTRYILAYLVGYGLDWCMLYLFVDRLGYPHQLVQAAAVLIVAAYLFPTLKFFVFPARTTEGPRSLPLPS